MNNVPDAVTPRPMYYCFMTTYLRSSLHFGTRRVAVLPDFEDSDDSTQLFPASHMLRPFGPNSVASTRMTIPTPFYQSLLPISWLLKLEALTANSARQPPAGSIGSNG